MKHTIATLENSAKLPLCTIFTSEKVFRKQFFINHKHAELELSLILGGGGRYRTQHGVLPIVKGDIFLFSSNEEHCITDASGLSLLNIHISPRFFWSFSEGCRFLDLYYRPSISFSNRIESHHPAAISVAPLFSAIQEEAVNRCPDYTHAIRALLCQLFIRLYRMTDYARKDPDTRPRPGAESLEKVCRAADFIDLHYREAITLEEIASHIHLSRTYFSSLFTSCYGMPVWDYINIRRVEYAKGLLRGSDDTVLSIALQSGYNSTANFNRAFRHATGTTPSAYRAQKEKKE